MNSWYFTRKNLWGVVGVLAIFAVGLGAGTLLSRYVFAKKEKVALSKLSEFAAPPGQIEKLAPSSLPPIGLSPVPPEGQQPPSSAVEVAGREKTVKIPWANPYPAYSFLLKDQDGNQLSLKDLSGRVVLVNFIYTHCKTVCLLETQELRKLQKALGPLMGREVLFLSISIDPKRDTPEALRRYGEQHGVDFRSWGFLTGSEEMIRKVVEAYRVDVKVVKVPGTSRGSYELGHGAPIYLIDQWGRVRKRTAATMLVRTGRQAIEYLVKEGRSDVSKDEDLIHRH